MLQVDELELGVPTYVLLGDASAQDLYDYQEYMYFAATSLRDSRAELYNTSHEDMPMDEDLWKAIGEIIEFETSLASVSSPDDNRGRKLPIKKNELKIALRTSENQVSKR